MHWLIQAEWNTFRYPVLVSTCSVILLQVFAKAAIFQKKCSVSPLNMIKPLYTFQNTKTLFEDNTQHQNSNVQS